MGRTPSRMHEKWTQTRQGRIHYQLADASGPTVVFLPGGALDSSALTWKKVARSLPDGYRVFVLDLPGYGGSDALTEPYLTTGAYGAFVRNFFRSHDIRDAVVLGASVGGAVALHLTAADRKTARRDGSPRRIRALVLSGSHGLRRRLPFHRAAYVVSRLSWPRLAHIPLRRRAVLRVALRLVIHDPSRIDAELVRDALAESRRTNALRAFSLWLRNEIGPRSVASDFRDDLPDIDVPVLLLQGRYDWLVPEDVARAAASQLPNAELEVLEAGHMVPRERPDESARIVRSFLSRAAPLP